MESFQKLNSKEGIRGPEVEYWPWSSRRPDLLLGHGSIFGEPGKPQNLLQAVLGAQAQAHVCLI